MTWTTWFVLSLAAVALSYVVLNLLNERAQEAPMAGTDDVAEAQAHSLQHMADPYKASVEKGQSEVYLRSQIAEQTTAWVRRYGGPRVLTAMREWLDYMDRQVATMERHGMLHNDGPEAGKLGS